MGRDLVGRPTQRRVKGIVHPASTANTDTSQLKHWVDAPLAEGEKSFQLVRPKGSNLVFGPGIGDLADMPDRITVINGLAMNTVAHPDGEVFSATGRHPQGGRVAASSVDTVIANEISREKINFCRTCPFGFRRPTWATTSIAASCRSPSTTSERNRAHRFAQRALRGSEADRDRVTALLSEEARDLAKRSTYPDVLQGLDLQFQSLSKMLGSNLQEVFSTDGLKKAHTELNYKSRFAGSAAVNAAFAIEAMKRNLVRCVSFAVGGFDTHGNNYRTQAQLPA